MLEYKPIPQKIKGYFFLAIKANFCYTILFYAMDKLEINNLTIELNEQIIINELELEIFNDKITAILGPNGTGKSTLFKSIIGQIKAKTGSIKINDTDINKLPIEARIKQGLAYLPQKTSIFRELTVQQNLFAAAEKMQSGNIQKVMYEFNIHKLANKKGKQLSGGQTRIVEIARCMMLAPKFLLLDEPFAGIDPKTINLIKQILITIKNRGVGVVITDHQAEKTINMSDDNIILHKGKIMARGSSQEILKNKQVKDIYLGSEK